MHLARALLPGFSLFLASSTVLAEPSPGTPVGDFSHADRARKKDPELIVAGSAFAFPGFGGAASADAWVASHLYLGVEGGTFSAYGYSQWFAGARASYRIPLTPSLSLSPSLGVSHVGAARTGTSDVIVVRQAPISPTAGLDLSLAVGSFVLGARASLMPVLLTESPRDGLPDAPLAERTKTLVDVPLGVYVGIAL